MNCAESNDPSGTDPARAPTRSATPGRTARHRAREFALQGLYGWLLSGSDRAEIADQLKALPAYGRADEVYLLELMQGTTALAEALRALFVGDIDRPLADLSPIEHSILLIATYEL